MLQADEVTEDLPEIYRSWPLSMAILNPVPDPVPSAEDRSEGMEDEPTVVETVARIYPKQESKLSALSEFLFTPDYPKPFSIAVRRYLREVRQRMIESREFHQSHYANSLYQRFRRFLRKCLIHVHKNLRQ